MFLIIFFIVVLYFLTSFPEKSFNKNIPIKCFYSNQTKSTELTLLSWNDPVYLDHSSKNDNWKLMKNKPDILRLRNAMKLQKHISYHAWSSPYNSILSLTSCDFNGFFTTSVVLKFLSKYMEKEIKWIYSLVNAAAWKLSNKEDIQISEWFVLKVRSPQPF